MDCVAPLTNDEIRMTNDEHALCIGSRALASVMRRGVFVLALLAAEAGLPAQTPAPAPAPAAPTEQPPAMAPAAAGSDGDLSDLANPLAEFPAGNAAATMPAKAAGPVDPDLPQPFDPSNITKSMKTSPFNRSVNMSDNLVLTGVAYVEGKPMATLLDKESKKTYVVSEEPNHNGWTLTEAPRSSDIKRMQVKVSIGGEVVTIRHNEDAQNEQMKKGKNAPAGNPPPPPSGRPEDRGFRRDQRGPPPEVIQRYQALSEEAKSKLRKSFEDNRERITNMNPEERRAFMEKNFKTIAEEDESKRK